MTTKEWIEKHACTDEEVQQLLFDLKKEETE